MSTRPNQFEPDYAISPGEILEETLDARGMKKTEFAERCGRSDKMISQIISGLAPITAETAIQFERVLGINASVWNNLEANYRLILAKAEQQKELKSQISWAKRFPIKDMVRLRFVSEPKTKTDQVEKLLDFFGVGSVSAWEEYCARTCVAYLKSPSFKSAPESVMAWLRMNELIASEIETLPYQKDKFVEALSEIRNLTIEAPEVFVPVMTKLCAQSGVAITFVPELPKTHLRGAARWINKEKALIMLSLRHKSDDHFWFTFFHEAGHILLHGKKEVFIDDTSESKNGIEEEANIFSRNILIPSKDYNRFVNSGYNSIQKILQFSQAINISPGVVVGRLQHDKLIDFSRFNRLKKKFVWA